MPSAMTEQPWTMQLLPGPSGHRPQQLLLLVLLAALQHAVHAQVLGDVFLYDPPHGDTGQPTVYDPFPTLPADFGPDVGPDAVLDGLLLVADPADACRPLRFAYEEPWVALIDRAQRAQPTNCTFDVKVRHAEAAGAIAAIVHDDVYEALVIMSRPRGHPDVGIPAFFVSQKAGLVMKKLMTPGVTRVRIVPVSASAWMSLLMSAFLGFLALTVVLSTFWVMRSWSMWLGRTRRRGGLLPPGDLGALGGQAASRQQGLPASVIAALPLLIYQEPSGSKAARSRRRDSTTGSTQGSGGVMAAADVLPASAPAAFVGAWLPGPQALQPADEDASSTAAAAAAAESGAPSGLVSLTSLAAAGSRLLRFSKKAPPDAGGSGGTSSNAPPAGLLGMQLQAPAAAAGIEAGGGGGADASSPAPSLDGSSAPYSTDDDDCEPFTLLEPHQAAGGSTSTSSSLQQPQGLVVKGPGVPVGARGGATRRLCVICLESYASGDKVRVLPCQHRFHAACVDLWLANRRLCPVCKHDASIWPAAGGAGAAAAAAARAAGLQPPQPAADAPAADAAEGDAALGLAGAPGGLAVLGHRYLRRLLHARLARHLEQQQQQQHAASGAAGATSAAAGQPAGAPLSPAAAAVAAAAAAADAAEAGLLRQQPGMQAALAAQPPRSHRPQQRWSRRWSQQGNALTQPLLLAPQQQQDDGDGLVRPPRAPLPSPGGRQQLASAERPVATSLPVPIPQLTPAQSVASSVASRGSVAGEGPSSRQL